LAEGTIGSSRYTIKGSMLVPKMGADPAVFFCWQHKEQAVGLIDGAKKVDIAGRTSLETVLKGLGLEEVPEEEEEIEGAKVEEKVRRRKTERLEDEKRMSEKRKEGKKQVGFLTRLLSCLRLGDGKSKPRLEAVRSKTSSRTSKVRFQDPARIPLLHQQRHSMSPSPLSRPPQPAQSSSAPSIQRKPLQTLNGKQLKYRSQSSPLPKTIKESTSLAQWTPSLPSTPTDITRLVYAKLLTAMSEPPTPGDGKGYIYMFWETSIPTSQNEISSASLVARGLATARDMALFERRAKLEYSNNASPSAPPRSVFLKIGKASNVRRRLSQWRNQCRYNIALLRYYPQEKNQINPGESIKFMGKVEKLVHLHLEMLGLRVNRQCRCGTEHREWFEVMATESGIREVDGVIGKWVGWCRGKYGVGGNRDEDD
jgi:hypothetical protein